jgi:hypothetical protein
MIVTGIFGRGTPAMQIKNCRPILFLTGILGMPLCVWGWLQWHHIAWLFGMTIAMYLVVMSVGEAVAAAKRDVAEYRRMYGDTSTLPTVSGAATSERKPLRQNRYFRAGIMGLPFCVFEWFWKHELIFLLGGGFFAGLLLPTLYAQWKWRQAKRAPR